MTRLTGILLFHRAHCGPRCRWGFFHVGAFPIEVAVIADEAEAGGWGLTGERGWGREVGYLRQSSRICL